MAGIAVTILEQGALVGLIAQGARVATRPGMVLGWVAEPMRAWAGEQPMRKALIKPLVDCSRCMVSTWGTAALFTTGTMPEPAFLLPLVWAIGAGLQDVLDQ